MAMDKEKSPLQDFFLGKEGREMEEDPKYYSEIEKRAGKIDEEKDVTNRETPYSQGYFSELDRTGENTLEKGEEGSVEVDRVSQEGLFRDEDFEE